jgi:hypothetical protein
MKLSPLLVSILGAIAMVLTNAISHPPIDLKVVGFGVLIAALGKASQYFKAKGATWLGILGAIGYQLFTMLDSGSFSWKEFVVAGLLAGILVVIGGPTQTSDSK